MMQEQQEENEDLKNRNVKIFAAELIQIVEFVSL